MIKLIKSLKASKSGASAAEYALIVAILGAIVVTATGLLGGGINTAMQTATGQLNAAGAAGGGEGGGE